MPQSAWIFKLNIRFMTKLAWMDSFNICKNREERKMGCFSWTAGGALSLCFIAWHSLLHSAILDRLFLLPANSILCLWRRKKRIEQGRSPTGGGVRQAETQPQTPLLSTCSPGTYLAAVRLHPKPQMQPVPTLWTRNPVVSGYWTPNSDWVLTFEKAGVASPFPLQGSEPEFRCFFFVFFFCFFFS